MVFGKQGLALCGHHDDKILWNEQDEFHFEKHGNFIELVCFRAETDEVLNKYLHKNAHYTYKTIQNQVFGAEIRTTIITAAK